MLAKTRNLFWIATAELLAMALWFSASVVSAQLVEAWGLGDRGQAWITMSVQLGFVVGALASAVTNLADRVDPARLFAGSALVGAACTAAIAILEGGPGPGLVLRFLTGVALAGVYPPGMKLMATWCKEDRGFGIGILVGALTLGSASPHLLLAVVAMASGGDDVGLPPWRVVLLGAALLAVVAAAIARGCISSGPHANASAPFDWRVAPRVLTLRAPRLANLGYLGHMWELYAMWTWVPTLLIASWATVGAPPVVGYLAGFAAIGVGAPACVAAGRLADRFGRTAITIASLGISGACALVAGGLTASPVWLTVLCLVWGFAVVADSAQFSAAVTELTDSRYLGTALTLQTSLGFLLTMVSIRMLPLLAESVGQRHAFALLALGPVLGILCMLRLRALPEARQMAAGRR